MLQHDTLDDFVQQVDRDGGIGTLDPSWRGVSYKPTYKVDQSLDPFSEAYVEEQLKLYREISGRDIDQQTTEMTDFDFDRHLTQPNAFGGSVDDLAVHYARLSKMMMMTRMPANPRILDLGCGWGMSSELFASMGCNVTAVDINPRFAELVRRRSAMRNLNITALDGSFEAVDPPGTFDLVTFYECLHHAVRPWVVIDRFARRLSPNGAIAFAGEPVQAIWWRNWGVRLDPISIYCIRKHGWFESGWSVPFLAEVFRRSGLLLDYREDADFRIGGRAIAFPGYLRIAYTGSKIASEGLGADWWNEGRLLVGRGESSVVIKDDLAKGRLKARVINFRQAPLTGAVLCEKTGQRTPFVLQPGDNMIDAPYDGPGRYSFPCETWSPHTETGSADERTMSFHLDSIEVWTEVDRTVTIKPGKA